MSLTRLYSSRLGFSEEVKKEKNFNLPTERKDVGSDALAGGNPITRLVVSEGIFPLLLFYFLLFLLLFSFLNIPTESLA